MYIHYIPTHTDRDFLPIPPPPPPPNPPTPAPPAPLFQSPHTSKIDIGKLRRRNGTLLAGINIYDTTIGGEISSGVNNKKKQKEKRGREERRGEARRSAP